MEKKNLMIIGGVVAIAAIAYFVFKKKSPAAAAAPAGTNSAINAKMAAIRGNAEWLAAVSEKAQNSGKTLDEQVMLDAQYCLDSKTC
jgi:hypothetical protein